MYTKWEAIVHTLQALIFILLVAGLGTLVLIRTQGKDVVKVQNIQGPFVILTRNELDFAEAFADRYAEVFTEIGLELVGVIGRTHGFRFSSRTKLDFLPEGSVFIGDCFEHADLRAHPRYHNVLHREAWNTFVARIRKGWYCVKNILWK